jgi:hypothetical protein
MRHDFFPSSYFATSAIVSRRRKEEKVTKSQQRQSVLVVVMMMGEQQVAHNMSEISVDVSPQEKECISEIDFSSISQ